MRITAMLNRLPCLALAAIVCAVPALLARATAGTLPRLHADGIKVVDPAGREVRLCGINLGGWLVQEMWMSPWVQDPPAGSSDAKIVDDAGLWSELQTRFGDDGMQRVRTAYRNAWLQPSDFAAIKAAGFNHVRLPFLHGIVDEPGGLDWLKKAVRWAGDNGLYVILDMHGAPNGQSADHTTGKAGVNRFFFDADNVSTAEREWTLIARTFADDPVVTGFDLVNEPTGAPNPATLHIVHARLYNAVRKAAPNTMVIVEDGYKGFDTTPHPNVAGWTNVIYSLHFYNFDAKSIADHLNSLNSQLKHDVELRGYRSVPLYIGEFNIEPHSSPSAMADYIRTMDEVGFSWAIWTFKTVARGGPMGYWGLYRNTAAADPTNPFTDSEAGILAKISQVRTERLSVVDELLPVFRNDAASRIRP